MTFVKTLAVVTLAAAGVATVADIVPAAAAEYQSVGYGYGYGPGPYGYGPRFRRFGWRRPNGTGYYGRGTRTGGPVGGLPGRS